MKKTPCPHCKKEAIWKDNPWRPFCSERCKMIDLGAWLVGDYAIPGEPAEKPDEPKSSIDFPPPKT